MGMLGGAHIAGRVVATVRGLDRGDRWLLEADPTPVDEHEPHTTTRNGRIHHCRVMAG